MNCSHIGAKLRVILGTLDFGALRLENAVLEKALSGSLYQPNINIIKTKMNYNKING